MWVMGSEAADISACSALPGSGKAKEPLGAARKVPYSQMPWAVVALPLDGMPQVSKPWFVVPAVSICTSPCSTACLGKAPHPGPECTAGCTCPHPMARKMVREWSESSPPSSSFALAKRFMPVRAQSKSSQPTHTFLRHICGHFNCSHCPGWSGGDRWEPTDTMTWMQGIHLLAPGTNQRSVEPPQDQAGCPHMRTPSGPSQGPAIDNLRSSPQVILWHLVINSPELATEVENRLVPYLNM